MNEAWSALGAQASTNESGDEGDFGDENTESASEADLSSDSWSGSSFDDDEMIDRYHDYGDLDEIGGKYKIQLADGREISLEEHERFYRCVSSEGISDLCCTDGGNVGSSDESSVVESVD